MHDNAYLEGANSPEASFTFYYLVPLPVFEELFPGQGYRQLAVDIDHSQQSSFEAFLSQYEQGLNRGISVTTVSYTHLDRPESERPGRPGHGVGAG